QHHLGRLLTAHTEELLQNCHDKLHWREVVVEQQHLEHRRRLDTRFPSLENGGGVVPGRHDCILASRDPAATNVPPSGAGTRSARRRTHAQGGHGPLTAGSKCEKNPVAVRGYYRGVVLTRSFLSTDWGARRLFQEPRHGGPRRRRKSRRSAWT